jgi:hypothetical protein
MPNNWTENKIVFKIYELRKFYFSRFGYDPVQEDLKLKIKDFFECNCCGNLTRTAEYFWHKDTKQPITLCPQCGTLWRILPKRLPKIQFKNETI